MPKRNLIFAVLALVISLMPLVAFADDAEEEAKEYVVKAAYISRFQRFVLFYGKRADEQNAKTRICILGSNPFGDAFDQYTQQSSNPALAVVQNPPVKDLGNCRILYVSPSEEERWPSILEALGTQDVLTISDMPGFIHKGGMIEMARVEEHTGVFSKMNIRLKINEAAGRKAHITFDALFLEVAIEIIR
jgi:hypothetical protein